MFSFPISGSWIWNFFFVSGRSCGDGSCRFLKLTYRILSIQIRSKHRRGSDKSKPNLSNFKSRGKRFTVVLIEYKYVDPRWNIVGNPWVKKQKYLTSLFLQLATERRSSAVSNRHTFLSVTTWPSITVVEWRDLQIQNGTWRTLHKFPPVAVFPALPSQPSFFSIFG
jgi:hypothetical protein